jgi:aspartate/methionine/tyrosine aminotransferase
MKFFPFEMERWQSTWENRVRYNLSESGVHPLTPAELLELAGADPGEVLSLRLGYNQGNGTDQLRERISALYPGATPDQVLVTCGSAEANYVICWRLLEPGDKVAIMVPNYGQTNGQARNLGAELKTFPLHRDLGWEPRDEEIAKAIVPGTKLVVVTNPNNPTGHVLSDRARKAIVAQVAKVGAWLLADEVYAGAERAGDITRSFWGSYDKLICVSGLSKAYGLPGLRIGWLVAPRAFTDEAWARKDYTTIGPTVPSDRLATLALEPKTRERIFKRTRGIISAHFPILETWLKGFGNLFSWTPPDAGAICYACYAHPIGALDLVEKLRADHSVLLEPGEHFEMASHIRFGFGGDRAFLEEALAETGRGLRRIMAD